jgi:hypothetical protein
MKLPSCTSVVIVAIFVGLGFASYKIYSRVAAEGDKAMHEASEYMDGYETKKKTTDRKKAADLGDAKEKADIARDQLNKRSSTGKKKEN